MNEPLEYLTINESNAFLKAINEPRDKAIITLFICNGLFVNELINLQLDDIDFKARLLKIQGKRKRDLPLNDQAHDALATWSKERITTPSQYLFITLKGQVEQLSVRGIDKIIRKYADLTGLNRNVNAKVLRNTFAVNLFKQAISLQDATSLLGITDPESIRRYLHLAKTPIPFPTLNQTDTRPKAKKFLARLFPISPKSIVVSPKSKAKTGIKNLTVNPEEMILGRDEVIKEITDSLKLGQSVLIVGQIGIGKTHLLKHINQINQKQKSIYINSPVPIKTMLFDLCKRIDSNWKASLGTRPNTKEILEFLAKLNDKPILVIDNLHYLRTSDLETILFLIENFTILGATEETNQRLKQIWWKFKKIELKPLDEKNSKILIKYLTENLSITDYELLEKQILNYANGIPLAMIDMVRPLSFKKKINSDDIHELYHDVGTKYREWFFLIIILWGIVISFRFIALGLHSFEGYILAGFGTSILLILRFVVFKMR